MPPPLDKLFPEETNIAGRPGGKNGMKYRMKSTKGSAPQDETRGAQDEGNNGSGVNGDEWWKTTGRPRIIGKSENANEIVVVGYMPDALFHALRDETEITQEMIEEYRLHAVDCWHRNEALETVTICDAEIDEQADAGENLLKTKDEPLWKKYGLVSILTLANGKVDKSLYPLGDGWLERGDGGIIYAGAGVGKSVLTVQLAIKWSLGLAECQIRPACGPMKIIVVQAEDGPNDQVRMAQMLHHMGLDDRQKEMAAENFRLLPCSDLVGDQFFKMLDGLMQDNKTDLIMINPLHSYLSGCVTDEEKVKDFLRLKFTPLLKKHQAGGIIVHHTTKQNYRDTDNWKPSDFMYGMAGAAEFTNWPRMVIGIEPTGDLSTYKMIAAKRWKRSEWKEMVQHISHSKSKDVMLWLPATEQQIAAAGKPAGSLAPEALAKYVTGVDPVSSDEIKAKAKRDGFTEAAFERAMNEAQRLELIFKDVIRDGGLQKRYGFVTSPPCIDIPGALEDLIPVEGIRNKELVKSAFDKYGYYSAEVDDGAGELVRSGRVEMFTGEGAFSAARILVRAKDADQYQQAHPKAARCTPTANKTSCSTP